MSKAYLNDAQRLEQCNFLTQNCTVWNIEDIEELQDKFLNKGHIVLPVSRMFVFKNVGYRFNAFIVPRYSRADIEEYLFTQRIEFYSRVEDHESVALIFINQTSADEILQNIKHLKKGDVE